MTEKTKVFISYSRKDRERVEQLYRALAVEDDLTIFRDTDDILPTEEWKPRLEKLIRQSDTILFALSPQSASSQVCAWELELADALNKRVIPVVVENVDGQVPDVVSKLNYIFLTESYDFGTALKSIQAAISTDIDWIREHTRLAELAERWDKAVRMGAQVLRGSELQAAEAWLVEQPKDAPQPTTTQRRYILESRKAATKRQRMAVIGALAAMVVVAMLGIFGWTQRNAALAGERKAEAALRTATEASRAMMFELAQEFSSSSVPGSTIRKILDRAQDLQSGLMENFPDDRRLRASEAISLTKIGDTLYQSGDFGAARQAYENAQAKQIQLLTETPDHPSRQHALGVTKDRLGDLALAEGRIDEAKAYHQSALEIYRQLDLLDPQISGYGSATAYSLDKLGQMAFDAGQFNDAKTLYKQASDLRAALVARDADNLNWQNEYASSLSSMSDIAKQQNDFETAEQLLQQALAIRDQLIKKNPDNAIWKRGASTLLDRLADLAIMQNDSSSSAQYHARGLDIARAMVQIDPQNNEWQRDLAVSLTNIGKIQQAAENFDAAQSNFEEAREILSRLVLISPTAHRWKNDMARVEMRLGILAERQNDPKTATARYLASADILRDLIEKHPDSADYASKLGSRLSSLAGIAATQGNTEKALADYAQALKWRTRAAELLPHDPISQREVTGVLYETAKLWADAKQYDEALQAYEEMVAQAEKLVVAFPDNAQLADDRRIAGNLFAGQAAVISFGDILFDRLEKAEALCRDALELAPDNRRLQAHLAYALMFQDKTDAAREILITYREDLIDGDPWKVVVLKDFETFTSIGLPHPLMAEIEAAY
jgi:tetratricopeptide (TPR) repeat protein